MGWKLGITAEFVLASLRSDEEALHLNKEAVAMSTVAVAGRYVIKLLLYGVRGESVIVWLWENLQQRAKKTGGWGWSQFL